MPRKDISFRYFAGPSTQPGKRSTATAKSPSFYPLYRGTINATPDRQNSHPTRGFGTLLHTNRYPTSLPTELQLSNLASSLATGTAHVAPRHPRSQPQNASYFQPLLRGGWTLPPAQDYATQGHPTHQSTISPAGLQFAVHPVRHPPASVSSSTGISTSPDRASAGTSPGPPGPHPSCTPAGSSPPRRPADRSDRRRSR